VADGADGDVFFLLPQVLLDRGASAGGFGAEGLSLLAVERLLEWVRAKG